MRKLAPPHRALVPWLSVVCFAMTLTSCGPAAADDPVGWRTDGTGRYPDATPPTEWSVEDNVIWATPAPDWSNSSPVIVGNRLLTCAEPTTLLCLDTQTGEILWQASNSYEDIAPTEELADMQKLQAECDELRKQVGQVAKQMRQVRKKLQDDPENAGLKAEHEKLKQELVGLKQKLQPYNETWYVLPTKHNSNGYSSATPVSDGEHVWAVFGTGVVVCYDLDGNRQWAIPLEKPRHPYGHSASPVLADGKLIVHINQLSALEPETGEIIWQQPLPMSWGTPVVTTIGDAEVIITAAGDIVAASDGTVLARSLAKLTYCAPLLHDDVVYFIEHGGKAVRLPGSMEAPFTPEVLWQTQPKKDRYYASPVYHEGLLYAVTQAGIFSAIDAETGQVVYEQNLTLGKGTVYPSVTYAGGLVFVSSDNGNTVVIQPGREYVDVGRNSLGPFRGSPVFVGDRMYVRGFENIYCVGGDGGG